MAPEGSQAPRIEPFVVKLHRAWLTIEYLKTRRFLMIYAQSLLLSTIESCTNQLIFSFSLVAEYTGLFGLAIVTSCQSLIQWKLAHSLGDLGGLQSLQSNEAFWSHVSGLRIVLPRGTHQSSGTSLELDSRWEFFLRPWIALQTGEGYITTPSHHKVKQSRCNADCVWADWACRIDKKQKLDKTYLQTIERGEDSVIRSVWLSTGSAQGVWF